MFGQMLPGSEPRSNEDLDWHSNPKFRQTSIFGDIQPWDLDLYWVEQCIPSQNWSDVVTPEIDITRC
jgi:hypothetical protein